MATRQDLGAIPDFLRMDEAIGSDPATANKTGNWHGWPTKDLNPVTLMDDEGRTVRIRTPVMDLEGLITPTDLHYTVQHFDVPPVVPTDQWELKIHGQVKNELTLNFDQLRRFPGRSVRTVMECSGSDATFFEYFKDEGPKPSRTQECMILSASEWTGVPLAAVLNAAGLDDKSLYVRAIGNDEGVPATAAEGTKPFYYDKGLPMQKALHPDTILAWAQNGQLLEHLHGAPVRLLVPGWSGNWSVKWITDLEILDHMPDCWYHYQFYYYGNSPEDPNKELITTQRRHRKDDQGRTHAPRLRLERCRRHLRGRCQRRRRRHLALSPHRTAPRPVHVGAVVLSLGRGQSRRTQHHVPRNRRSGPGTIPRASIQQHAQELQRDCWVPGHSRIAGEP